MKIPFIILIPVLAGMVITSCAKLSHNILIVPGVSVGDIRPDTSERDLIKIFGRQLVIPSEISVGEGELEPGTLIIDPDSLSLMGIIWKDNFNRKNPREIRLTGTRCKWKTAEGVTLGVTLKELESANGKPFKLTGFEWDYAGTFMSSNQGKLSYLDRTKLTENSVNYGKMLIRMQPGRESQAETSGKTEYTVLGDSEFSSDLPVMQHINPSVYEMIIFFP